MKPKSPTQVEQAHALIADLTMLHYRAMQCGLYKTGQKLHEAVKQSGWELAEWIEDLRAENEKLAALDGDAARAPRAEARESATKHVCGLQGFGRGRDGINDECPACKAPRDEAAAREEGE